MSNKIIWSNIPILYLKILVCFLKTNSLTECSKQYDLHISQIKRYFDQISKHIGFDLYAKQGNKVICSERAQEHLKDIEKFIHQIEPIFREKPQLKMYLTILLSTAFAKNCLPKIPDREQIKLASYSQALFRDYGLLTKQIINTYDLIFINKAYEALIDQDIWICKSQHSVEVGLYASKNFLQQNEPIKSPACLAKHECISVSNHLENIWILKDKNGVSHSVDIASDIIIDTTFIQSYAVSKSLGIAILEKTTVQYFNDDELVEVLPEYELEPLHWAVYIKNSCTHPQLEKSCQLLEELLKGLK
ncbi:LysR substrate-binding domain-containing protein [Francisellaceae bacterium]|nr:LysR substrate-binding domain-containing protein [Francisellaceae bacterium]